MTHTQKEHAQLTVSLQTLPFSMPTQILKSPGEPEGNLKTT